MAKANKVQCNFSKRAFYTFDAEYVVGNTPHGHKVTRGDGCYVEFFDIDDATGAAYMLAAGERADSDYDWHVG